MIGMASEKPHKTVLTIGDYRWCSLEGDLNHFKWDKNTIELRFENILLERM